MDVDLEAVWDACLARANRGSGSAVCRGEGEEGSTAHGYEGAWRQRSVSVKGWDHLPHDAMHFERARHGSASQDEAGHVTSGRYGIGKGFGANMMAFGANLGLLWRKALRGSYGRRGDMAHLLWLWRKPEGRAAPSRTFYGALLGQKPSPRRWMHHIPAAQMTQHMSASPINANGPPRARNIPS